MTPQRCSGETEFIHSNKWHGAKQSKERRGQEKSRRLQITWKILWITQEHLFCNWAAFSKKCYNGGETLNIYRASSVGYMVQGKQFHFFIELIYIPRTFSWRLRNMAHFTKREGERERKRRKQRVVFLSLLLFFRHYVQAWQLRTWSFLSYPRCINIRAEMPARAKKKKKKRSFQGNFKHHKSPDSIVKQWNNEHFIKRWELYITGSYSPQLIKKKKKKVC